MTSDRSGSAVPPRPLSPFLETSAGPKTPSGRSLRLFAVALFATLGSGCAIYRDPEPTRQTEPPSAEEWTRLEESWGPGEFAALLTGTVSSKDRNFWMNIPFASWYVRDQDRKGGGVLGGALAYDMVTVNRHQGRAESKKMTSVGLLGIAGRLEERKLDGSRGYSKHHWLFPFYRYKNVDGQRTVYPLFIFPIALRDDPHPGVAYDPRALAAETGDPIHPPGVHERRPTVASSGLLDPPPFEEPIEGDPYAAPAGLDSPEDWTIEPASSALVRTEDSVQNWDPPVRTSDDRGGATWRTADDETRRRSIEEKSEKLPTVRAASSRYTVRKGDSLFRIAREQYGSNSAWKKIYEANRDQLPSPDRLKVGMTLRLP